MLTLNDGRAELWQWDTGRTLAVDVDCSQVHFSNKVFGRSIDVDVVDGTAIIPDVLLQTDKDLNVWAFVGTAENGYTKISKTFQVNRRNKPADYVFTPPDQTSLEEIKERLEYLEQNPVESPVQSVNGLTGTVELNAEDVGAIAKTELPTAINIALSQAKASGEFDGTDGKTAYQYAVEGGYTGTEADFTAKMAELGDGLSTTEKTMLLSLFKNAAYTADMSATIAQLETLWSGDEEPDEPVTPDVTLSSISATYSGGSVPVGTAASSLTGVNVTAHYSDGSTATVTGYTLSGTIVEGNNTITVSYGGKTTTFNVTGVTDESGGDTEVSGDEYVVVTGATATDDGNGNVTVTGLTATDDRNGNITVS